MGSGKTAIGRALADLLQCDYLDNDELVELRTGSSKATLVAERGTEGLRAAEAEVAMDLITGVIKPGSSNFPVPAFVAGLPAGALLDEDIVTRLIAESTAYVVWLRASVETLAHRIEADPADRPWLSGDLAHAIESLRPPREAAFTRVADLVLDVDDLTPSEAAELVVAQREILRR